MVRYFRRERGRRWTLKAMLNAVGAVLTGITFVIVGYTKFVGGAWIALLLIPMLVLVFLQVHSRRAEVDVGLHAPNNSSAT
jgi:peptidoglycan/LPS O-acetylase OafA/YrhL